MSKTSRLLALADFLFNPVRDVEVFGMFPSGNLGDEAMLAAVRKTLPPGRCIPWQSFPNHPRLNSIVMGRKRPNLLVGGGTLIHGGETTWLNYVEAKSLQGAKVSFFGTGMAFSPEQISGRASAFDRWAKILGASEEIHLRGPQSVALCQEMCGKGEVFGDMAFLLHDEDLVVKDHARREDIVGINLGNCLGDQAQFEDAATQVVKSLSDRHFLVFHAVVASDLAPTRRVIARAGLAEGRFRIETHYFDPSAFMASIARYRAFVGLKLHAAGLAMVAGVPALMICYLPKSQDFMAPLAHDPDMLLPLPLPVDEVLSRVDGLLNAPERFVVCDGIARIAGHQRAVLRRIYMPEQLQG